MRYWVTQTSSSCQERGVQKARGEPPARAVSRGLLDGGVAHPEEAIERGLPSEIGVLADRSGHLIERNRHAGVVDEPHDLLVLFGTLFGVHVHGRFADQRVDAVGLRTGPAGALSTVGAFG